MLDVVTMRLAVAWGSGCFRWGCGKGVRLVFAACLGCVGARDNIPFIEICCSRKHLF